MAGIDLKGVTDMFETVQDSDALIADLDFVGLFDYLGSMLNLLFRSYCGSCPLHEVFRGRTAASMGYGDDVRML